MDVDSCEMILWAMLPPPISNDDPIDAHRYIGCTTSSSKQSPQSNILYKVTNVTMPRDVLLLLSAIETMARHAAGAASKIDNAKSRNEISNVI